MALHILPPNQEHQPTKSFGQTLSGGLEQIAQAKMGQIQQQHQRSQNTRALKALGFPHAEELSALPIETLMKYFEPNAQQGLEQGEGQGQQIQPGAETQPNQQHPGIISRRQAEAQREQLKMSRQQAHDLEKAERPYYEQVVKENQAANSTIGDLDRLIKLINRGKIVNPTEDHMQRYLSKILHINLKDLRGADTEEFEKIKEGFVKNAKNWFGSRVTNYDLQSFLKTLPTLATSHEGKLRLIGSMRAAAQAQQLRYNALKELIKNNGGHIPAYAALKVDEMVGPELDKLREEFVEGTTAPKLSQEAIEGGERGWWMRPLKGALTAPFSIPGEAISLLSKPTIGALAKALR